MQNVWQESMASIVNRKNTFNNYPPFQRDKVWSLSRRQRLIDSILREWPIGELVVANDESLLKGISYQILDGQQRLSAIFDFYDNKFKTSSRKWRNDKAGMPIEGGKYYSELTADAKSKIDNYFITFRSTNANISWQSLGDIFRRLQEGEKMSGGEKLWSYQSPMLIQTVERLKDSNYFKEVYRGRNSRKEIVKAICYLLLSDKRGTYCNLTRDALHDLAQLELLANDEQLNRLENRLNSIAHLFNGYQTKGLMEIVLLSQAIYLLEIEKCNIYKSEKGCCSIWWAGIITNSRGTLDNNTTKIILDWEEASGQAEFWLVHAKELYAIDGLCFQDKRRSFNEVEKLQAWSRQNGTCLYCGKRLYVGQAVGHHINNWANGGITNTENCIVLHPLCHEKLEQDKTQLSFIKENHASLS